jgi:MFS family permease
MTGRVSSLLLTMTLFGICKGLYDSNIFAALFDVVEPRARGTAAGFMNTVGWGGGALGAVAVGWASKHGRHASEVENMSEAIALCSLVYILSAALLFLAVFTAKRDVPDRAVQPLPEGTMPDQEPQI